MLETEDGRTTFPFASGACRHKLHPSNAPVPKLVTVVAMLTMVNLEQPLNAFVTMLLPDTIVSCVRLEQLKYVVEAKTAGTLRETRLTPEKAQPPMVVTDDGIVTDARKAQS